MEHQILIADSGEKQATFPAITSLRGRVLSIFRQETDGPYPSEMDIQVFIPAPTYCLQTKNCLFHNWKSWMFP